MVNPLVTIADQAQRIGRVPGRRRQGGDQPECFEAKVLEFVDQHVPIGGKAASLDHQPRLMDQPLESQAVALVQQTVEFQEYRPERPPLFPVQARAAGPNRRQVAFFAVDAHRIDHQFIFVANAVPVESGGQGASQHRAPQVLPFGVLEHLALPAASQTDGPGELMQMGHFDLPGGVRRQLPDQLLQGDGQGGGVRGHQHPILGVAQLAGEMNRPVQEGHSFPGARRAVDLDRTLGPPFDQPALIGMQEDAPFLKVLGEDGFQLLFPFDQDQVHIHGLIQMSEIARTGQRWRWLGRFAEHFSDSLIQGQTANHTVKHLDGFLGQIVRHFLEGLIISDRAHRRDQGPGSSRLEQLLVAQGVQRVMTGGCGVFPRLGVRGGLDFLNIEDLQDAEGWVGLKAFVPAPVISRVVMSDVHEQKVVALFRRDDDRPVIVADARAADLGVDGFGERFQVNGSLSAVVLKLADKLENLFLHPDRQPAKVLEHLPGQHQFRHALILPPAAWR